MPVSSFETVEFMSGWNQAVWEIEKYGLNHAQVILDRDLPDRVYNAYIAGKREAAKVSMVGNQLPMTAQELFA